MHTDIATLLSQARQGSSEALDALLPLVYTELRRMAARYLRRERAGHTLQPTALVHEAYIRLIDQENKDWRNRAHFLAIAAHMMRRVLVDHARSRNYQKRGGGAARVALDEAFVFAAERSDEIVALDDAMNALAAVDQRKCQVVEMRFFGGLSVEETAEVLGVSQTTIMRDWSMARAWLYRAMSGEAIGES
jgi:RNA polymerase sigma-70 factor, ECF subfamily